MRKRLQVVSSLVAACLVLVLTSMINIQSGQPSNTLLRSRAVDARDTFRYVVGENHPQPAEIARKRSNTPTEEPQSVQTETVLAVSTQPSDEAPEETTPEVAPTEEKLPLPPIPEPIPPKIDDCPVLPPHYPLNQQRSSYTVPEICRIKPPLPDPRHRCPDHWYEDRMPGPIERMPYERQYFVVDGKRVELDELDLDWILIYCPIEIEYVY